MSKVFSTAEVAKHNTKEDCWVILHKKVYNLSRFLPEHPGGVAVIMKVAGRDGTKAFEAIHSIDVLMNLEEADCLGNPLLLVVGFVVKVTLTVSLLWVVVILLTIF